MKADEWVEVRSKQEILATLDARGELDNLPFMPEMFQFCGKRFRVFRRAHKTCDTVNRTGGCWVDGAVHLDGVRCDGTAHAGCDAACLIFWKEAWLKPVSNGNTQTNAASHEQRSGTGCTEAQVLASTRLPDVDGQAVYSCQATRLPAYTSPAKWWDVRQYVEDVLAGNARVAELARGLSYVAFFRLVRSSYRTGPKLGPALVKLYDRFQAARGGVPFPRRNGTVPAGQKTPSITLNLKPGELVRIKSHSEILATLNASNKNRGMYFDAEEVPYCGGTYRVRSRVEKIIDERTGKLIKIKDSVILENVWCKGWYSDRRMFCPRAIYSFWKEIWLERASPETTRHELSADANCG